MNDDLKRYVEDLIVELGPSQNIDEFVPALWYLYDLGLTNMIEIGSSTGLSMMCWPLIVRGKCISIDLPSGPYGGQSDYRLQQRDEMWRKYFDDRIISIRGNSQDPNTINTVASILAEDSVDLLFIDGDHRYEYVKADYENYRQFLSDNGVIVFHDISPHDNSVHDPNYLVEVEKFWNELDGNKTTFEVEGSNMGIGILQL